MKRMTQTLNLPIDTPFISMKTPSSYHSREGCLGCSPRKGILKVQRLTCSKSPLTPFRYLPPSDTFVPFHIAYIFHSLEMTSPVLAGPIGDCCVQSVKHEGQAAGRTIQIAGVQTYLSEPSAQSRGGGKKVVLFFPDVFGPFYLNNQLTQDYFASQGKFIHGTISIAPLLNQHV